MLRGTEETCYLQANMDGRAPWRHPCSSFSYPSTEAVGGQTCVARRLDSAKREKDHHIPVTSLQLQLGLGHVPETFAG